MKAEEKRAFLGMYDLFFADMSILPEHIAFLRESMKPSGIHYSDMPKSHSQRDLMADFAARLSDAEEQYNDAVLGIMEVKKAIARLSDAREKRVLTWRFVKSESWHGISRFENASVRACQYALDKGIEHIRFDDVGLVYRLLKRYAKRRDCVVLRIFPDL